MRLSVPSQFWFWFSCSDSPEIPLFGKHAEDSACNVIIISCTISILCLNPFDFPQLSSSWNIIMQFAVWSYLRTLHEYNWVRLGKQSHDSHQWRVSPFNRDFRDKVLHAESYWKDMWQALFEMCKRCRIFRNSTASDHRVVCSKHEACMSNVCFLNVKRSVIFNLSTVTEILAKLLLSSSKATRSAACCTSGSKRRKPSF